MKRICFVLVMCCVLPALARPAAAQQPDPAALKDIHRLLEITGALKMGQQMAGMVSSQMMQAARAGGASIPPRAAKVISDVVEEELKTVFAPGGWMADGIAAIYAQHFTPEEIRGLIAFYETPIGRKVTETLPAIAQESMKLGMDWGEKQFPAVQKRIEQKLRAEGIIKNP